MHTIDDIISFVETKTGVSNVAHDDDIVNSLGCYGDDFFELIREYSIKFSVDISRFLWYFHSKEEGYDALGGFIFLPPNERVERIPITPLLLTKFADKGKWDIDYPDHHIPGGRYDLLINLLALLLILSIALYSLLKKC